MMLPWVYGLTVCGLLAAGGVAIVIALHKQAFQRFTTFDLATAAVLICLLHVAVIPWQIGLARVPGVDAFVFSIPYTAMFLLGLRIVPKAGFATLLIFGQGIFGQLLGRGINPAWWPYYLSCAVIVELFLLLVGNSLRSLPATIAAGLLRGAVAYGYMYLVLAPFLWQQIYAPWYVAMKCVMGLCGCLVGAILAWRVGPAVEKASKLGAA